MSETGIPDVEAMTQQIARLDFNAHKHSYVKLVDRGDPDTPDFEVGDITTDEDIHTIDFSPWTGARKAWILIRVIISIGAGAGGMALREKGNSNWANVAVFGGGPGTTDANFEIEVSTNAEGKCEYIANNIPWIQIDFLVRGVQE